MRDKSSKRIKCEKYRKYIPSSLKYVKKIKY